MRVQHRRRRIVAVIGAMVSSTTAACSGGSASSTPTSVATMVPNASSTTLTIVQQPYGFVPNSGASAIRLYPGPFSNLTNESRYAVATEGTSTTPVAVAWNISSPAVSLAAPPSGVVIPPPNGVEVTGVSFGKAMLTATTPTQTATVPVYAYPAKFFGCSYRVARPANFDPSPAPSRAPLAADAYVTGPLDSAGYSPCVESEYVTAPGTPFVFHFPYGATIVTDGDDPTRPVVAGAARGPAFESVRPTAYRDDFHAIPSSALEASRSPCSTMACGTIAGSILVFKTAGGRVVKLWIADIFSTGGATLDDGAKSLHGAYEVTTSPGGTFPY